jgi:hypothetical protein
MLWGSAQTGKLQQTSCRFGSNKATSIPGNKNLNRSCRGNYQFIYWTFQYTVTEMWYGSSVHGNIPNKLIPKTKTVCNAVLFLLFILSFFRAVNTRTFIHCRRDRWLWKTNWKNVDRTGGFFVLREYPDCVWRCRSQWPRGMRRRSAAARLLGFWVRITPGHDCLLWVLCVFR